MVYCDGLENRCAGNRTGGSNPSPSAIKRGMFLMNYLTLIILFVVALVVFAILWRKGSFLQLSTFFRETQEELKKCTWPTWDELLGSTVLVMVAVGMIGGFTVLVDYTCSSLIKLII